MLASEGERVQTVQDRGSLFMETAVHLEQSGRDIEIEMSTKSDSFFVVVDLGCIIWLSIPVKLLFNDDWRWLLVNKTQAKDPGEGEFVEVVNGFGEAAGFGLLRRCLADML